ncbi:MAG TPA: FkbM family methyltransferase [Bacteroidia bacterium]|nr:FkbM family methyltransferase [Bacteroidia bacterium]
MTLEKIKRKFSRMRLARLKKGARYRMGSFDFQGQEIHYSDSVSFAYTFEEIFLNRILDFETKNPNPFIIDVGANIGLVSIFCKKKYPSAELVCIEADPLIFKLLEQNIRSFAFEQVTLIQKAAWDKDDSTLSFFGDGADGGTLLSPGSNKKGIQVNTMRLSALIVKPVDFLKIDIEGAELVVMQEIETKLGFVQKIFIEYHSYRSKEQDLNEILNLLKAHGFLYHLEQFHPHSAKPFMQLNYFQDIHQMIGIYAWK